MKLYRSISYTKEKQNDHSTFEYGYFLTKNSCLDFIDKFINKEIKWIPLSEEHALDLQSKNREYKMDYYNEVIDHMYNMGEIEDGIIIFYDVQKVKK